VAGLGSGEINLATNQINYQFNIYTHQRLNLNVGGSMHVVDVKGTLENPVTRIASEEIIRQSSRILLGIATGGYSLLVEKLRDLLLNQKSPCQVVLEGS
jgi:hypothetical protein